MRARAGILLVLAVASCSSGPGEAEIVDAATSVALVPAMDQAAVSAASLSDAVADYCSQPADGSRQTAMAAWGEAKTAWERSELSTFFGPADMLRTVSKVDYAPISEPGIDDLLASDTVIDVDFVDNRAGSTQRGLGAIEYALFGEFDPDATPRVCELITASAEVVAVETLALHDAWTDSSDGGPPWVETFTDTMPPNDAIGDLVGAIVETLKRQSLLELGKGLGISAPSPEPDAVPEGAAGAGAAMYRAQLEGIRAVLDAGGETSLLALIAARDQGVADQIDALLDETVSDLEAIDQPIKDAMVSDPAGVEAIYQNLADLRALFEADVVSLLDVTLGFSDTDGDTG